MSQLSPQQQSPRSHTSQSRGSNRCRGSRNHSSGSQSSRCSCRTTHSRACFRRQPQTQLISLDIFLSPTRGQRRKGRCSKYTGMQQVSPMAMYGIRGPQDLEITYSDQDLDPTRPGMNDASASPSHCSSTSRGMTWLVRCTCAIRDPGLRRARTPSEATSRRPRAPQ